MYQYIHGITKLAEVVQNMQFSDYKIVVIENNGARHTYLDDLVEGCKKSSKVHIDLAYSENNLAGHEKGYCELQDVFDVISHYQIADEDFIVKMTGRYLLTDDSPFMDVLRHNCYQQYECILRYGSFIEPVDYQMKSCITGLIGMQCKYVKQIQYPQNECVEWKWAEATYLIDPSKIRILNPIGIYICTRGFFELL